MDKAIDKDSFWLRIGPLVGPIMIYFLLFIILLKTTEISIIIPLVAFGGLICSHVFRWKGVMVASISLGCVLIYHFLHQPSSTWGWTIVLSLSAVSSFVVTVLCSDSSAIIWEKLLTDLQDYKNTITHLGEKLSDSHRDFLNERSEILEKYEQLNENLKKSQNEAKVLERKFKLVSEELKAANAQQERIQQILYDTREQNAILSDAFATLQENGKVSQVLALSPKELVQAIHLQKEIDRLLEKCSSYEFTVQELKTNSYDNQEELKTLSSKIVDLQTAIDLAEDQERELKHTLQTQFDITSGLEQKLEKTNILVDSYQEEIKTLSNEIVELQTACQLSEALEGDLKEKLQKQSEVSFDLEIELQDAKAASYKDKEEIKGLNQEIADLQITISSSESKENEIKEALQAQFKETFVLEERLQSAKINIVKGQEEIKILSQKILDLQEAVKLKENQESDLKTALESQIVLIDDYKNQVQKLADLEYQLNLKNAELTENQSAETLIQDREIRRLNGLYHQLKEQFSLKSETLNTTRKELFLSQERWEAMQRDLEEIKLQDDQNSASLLQKNLRQAEREIDELEEEYLAEITHLEALIKQLSSL